MAGETGRNMFDDRMNILIYAVNLNGVFQNKDIKECVVDKHHVVIFKALNDLIALGYLEKVTCYKYQATDFAKQIFNIGLGK